MCVCVCAWVCAWVGVRAYVYECVCGKCSFISCIIFQEMAGGVGGWGVGRKVEVEGDSMETVKKRDSLIFIASVCDREERDGQYTDEYHTISLAV